MDEYQKFIGNNDLEILKNNFNILVSMINLDGYDLWIYYPSMKKLEKNYKFVKSVGNLIFINRILVSISGKEFISNSIVELGKVIIFYGHGPKTILQAPVKIANINPHQKRKFIKSFTKK
jgi:hypothetical protein